MKPMTLEVYLHNLLRTCDEMLDTLQKARLDSKDIERWKHVVDSYKKQPLQSTVYSNVDKYL